VVREEVHQVYHQSSVQVLQAVKLQRRHLQKLLQQKRLLKPVQQQVLHLLNKY
jgi:hypothetical protein